jgi:DNA-binding MarR family transcriptional regulator
VASLLLELTPVQMRALRAEARECRGSLTIPQFRLLVNLEHGPLNNKSLASLLGVSIPAASRMAEGLVKAGYIRKGAPAQGDKREVALSLTEKGRHKVQETKSHVRARLETKLSSISDDELLRAHAGLESLQRFFLG